LVVAALGLHMDDPQRDLQESVDDLAETLEALRAELRDPPRGPLGLPRPPTPGEFLRFTERYTLPAFVSLLETSIRVLELLAASIRFAEGRPFEERDDEPAPADPVAAVSRQTLRRLDDALSDLQSAESGGDPVERQVQSLLKEARDLRTEVDERLAGASTPPTGRPRPTDPEPVDIEVRDGDEEADDGDENDGVDVDVDRELEDIKREVGEDEFDRAPGPGGEDADRRDEDRSGPDDRREGDGSETQNGS
jgi:hypothetical protein